MSNAVRVFTRLPFIVAVAAAFLSVSWAPEAFGARVCGETDPKTNKPVRAALALDDKSVTDRALKRSAKNKTLSLHFLVKGCELVELSPSPTLLVLPTKDGDELPDDVLTIRRAEIVDSTFFLGIQIDAKKMDPGTYNSIVIARAPYLGSNRTPVTVSRSEDAAWKVLGIGALAALAGLVWLLILKVPVLDSSAFTRWRLLFLCLLAVAGGVYAAANNYYGQDVWTFGDNLRSLASAAFLATTTGSVAAVLVGAGRRTDE